MHLVGIVTTNCAPIDLVGVGAGDKPLERRVRVLLSAEPGAKQFLERPAIEVVAQSNWLAIVRR